MNYLQANKLLGLLEQIEISDRDYEQLKGELEQVDKDFEFLTDRITKLEGDYLAARAADKIYK